MVFFLVRFTNLKYFEKTCDCRNRFSFFFSSLLHFEHWKGFSSTVYYVLANLHLRISVLYSSSDICLQVIISIWYLSCKTQMVGPGNSLTSLLWYVTNKVH